MDNFENNINMKLFLIYESILDLSLQIYSKDQNFGFFQRSIPNQTKFRAMKLKIMLPHETKDKWKSTLY
jgi:hypothetical protein